MFDTQSNAALLEDRAAPLVLTNPAAGSGSPRAADGYAISFLGRDGTARVVSVNPDAAVFDQINLGSFARGTRIETEDGAKPVEDLAVGDKVLTKDAGYRPLKWIARRYLGAAELARKPDLLPIRIRAGALGDDTPSQDILVSPQFRVLLGDWRCEVLFGEEELLAPAAALLNDSTILRDHGATEVEYFHLMFDRHEIIFAEGIATDSCHPGYLATSTMAPEAARQLNRTFPQLDGNLQGFGSQARPGLKLYEVKVLMSRPFDQNRK